MSGGSFNYLFTQEPYSDRDLELMAQWLRDHGMPEAAEDTLALRCPRASGALEDLWRAVEWHVSGDWGVERVERAHHVYKHGPG